MDKQILQESYKLFHQFGIRSVTMEDISKHLSISKKTLYKYFSKKEDLVYQIAKGKIKANELKCIEICNASDNAIHEMILMMQILRELFKGMNSSVLFDLQKYYNKAWQLMEEHQNVFVRHLIEKNLARGIKEQLYRKDINIAILAKLRLEEVRLSFNPLVFEGHTLEEVQLSLLEHFMLGITTIKGHTMANEYKENTNE